MVEHHNEMTELVFAIVRTVRNGFKAVLSVQVLHLLFWPSNVFYGTLFTKVSSKSVNERTPDECHVFCLANGETEFCSDLASADVVQDKAIPR